MQQSRTDVPSRVTFSHLGLFEYQKATPSAPLPLDNLSQQEAWLGTLQISDRKHSDAEHPKEAPRTSRRDLGETLLGFEGLGFEGLGLHQATLGGCAVVGGSSLVTHLQHSRVCSDQCPFATTQIAGVATLKPSYRKMGYSRMKLQPILLLLWLLRDPCLPRSRTAATWQTCGLNV